jgi:hypothetical protein
MLVKSAIPSGAVVIDGFKSDDKFIATEAIPNYVMWEYRGHEELATNQVSCINLSGSDVELVSLMGGTYVGNNQFVKLTRFAVYQQPLDTPNNYPKNILLDYYLDDSYMPFFFGAGLLIPNGAQIFMTFDQSISNIRLVGLPRLTTVIGSIVISP